MTGQQWPTDEEVAQVLDFDDFPSGVALELIAAQVAAREKAAAEKALGELREFVTGCRTANPADASMGYDFAMFTVLERLDAARADVLAGEGER